MKDYLPTLKNSIKTGKLGKAKTLLSEIKDKHPAQKQEILQMIALASEKTAYELLLFLTDKAHKDPDIHDRLIQLTVDRAHLNYRFILILFENADRTTINHALPLMKHILSNETDRDLLSAIIRSAGKLKISGLINELAEFIFYDDLKLKLDAVNALERIGSEQALEMLKKAADTEKCDQDILDAIQVLEAGHTTKPVPEKKPSPAPSKQAAKTDFGNLTSPSAEKRFEALIHFSKEKIDLANALSQDHIYKDHDLSINLLWLVSRTIPLDAVNPLFDIIDQPKLDPAIKFLAYSALGTYPELESAASVIQGLSESAMFLRLAAIKALDKNLSDFVRADLKNRIESGTKKGEILAQTILDANARNIIEHLMISDTFSYMASNYLSKSAPIPALDTFIDILKSRNLKSTAKKYMDIKKERQKKITEQMIVISSCDAILNVYSRLIFSCGLSCLTFRQPQEAFEAIVFEKPSAVICDLFLTDISGIELAREVRELYPKTEVPVIISTLQRSLDKDQLNRELEDAGVTTLCDFPAKTSQIKSWIK